MNDRFLKESELKYESSTDQSVETSSVFLLRVILPSFFPCSLISCPVLSQKQNCFLFFFSFTWILTKREYSSLDGSASGEVDWQTAGCSTTTIWGCLVVKKHLDYHVLLTPLPLFLCHSCKVSFLMFLFSSNNKDKKKKNKTLQTIMWLSGKTRGSNTGNKKQTEQ